jgi:hypothetical protein
MTNIASLESSIRFFIFEFKNKKKKNILMINVLFVFYTTGCEFNEKEKKRHAKKKNIKKK